MLGKDAELWDARAELHVGLVITKFLRENPPPPSSQLAGDLEAWARNLKRDGQARLGELGERYLHAL